MAAQNQRATLQMPNLLKDKTLTVTLTVTGTRRFKYLTRLAGVLLGLARGCLLRAGYSNVEVSVEQRGNQHLIHESVV